MSKHTKKLRYIIHYVKPTGQLLFKIRFPKGGPTCRRQVVNSIANAPVLHLVFIKPSIWTWNKWQQTNLTNPTMRLSHITQCTICYRNVHACAHFCCQMVYCGICVWCIVGFVRWVYCYGNNMINAPSMSLSTTWDPIKHKHIYGCFC